MKNIYLCNLLIQQKNLLHNLVWSCGWTKQCRFFKVWTAKRTSCSASQLLKSQSNLMVMSGQLKPRIHMAQRLCIKARAPLKVSKLNFQKRIWKWMISEPVHTKITSLITTAIHQYLIKQQIICKNACQYIALLARHSHSPLQFISHPTLSNYL